MKPYVLAALAFVATAFASPTPDVTTLDREPEGPYRNVSLFSLPQCRPRSEASPAHSFILFRSAFAP